MKDEGALKDWIPPSLNKGTFLSANGQEKWKKSKITCIGKNCAIRSESLFHSRRDGAQE
jgi:hypothetical protein